MLTHKSCFTHCLWLHVPLCEWNKIAPLGRLSDILGHIFSVLYFYLGINTTLETKKKIWICILKTQIFPDEAPFQTIIKIACPLSSAILSFAFSIYESCSVQFSCSVVSNALWPHESQHARPPCPSPTPGVHSNSRPSSQWCHPAISSSVIPFSSHSQSLPASETFPMSQLFTWGGQSTGVSALASVLPMNTQDGSLSEWTGWISLQSKGLSRVFSNTTVQKHQFFGAQLSSQSNSHIHTWPQGKP